MTPLPRRPVPSRFELLLELEVDSRRPWPLGVPASGDVLQAIAGHLEVEGALQAIHTHVLSLLPEQFYDAARTCHLGAEDTIAFATASAWRAIVAANVSEAALGVDHPALQALIHEAARARETLAAAGYFSLDVGVGVQRLLTTLGEAIEKLVKMGSLPKPRRVSTGSQPRLLRVAAPPPPPSSPWSGGRVLKTALALSLLTMGLLQLSSFVGDEDPPVASWVVVGDLQGAALLAPALVNADDASLREDGGAGEAALEGDQVERTGP